MTEKGSLDLELQLHFSILEFTGMEAVNNEDLLYPFLQIKSLPCSLILFGFRAHSNRLLCLG